MITLRVIISFASLANLSGPCGGVACGSVRGVAYIRRTETKAESLTSEHQMDNLLCELNSALPAKDTLATQILDSFCHGTSSLESAGAPVLYLPEGKINGIIKKTAIVEELQRYDRHRVSLSRGAPLDDKTLEDFSDWIYHHAKKIYAITLYCALDDVETLMAMASFHKVKFGDDELPVEELDPRVTPLSFPPSIWFPVRLQHFYDHQWKFLVPVFTRGKYDYDLKPNVIFPFTMKSSALPKVGGFGAVYRARFHKDHQEDQQFLTVAVKEIKISAGNEQTSVDSAWEREAVSLREINQLNHPHITPCIAAIRRGDGRYFMFPWADGDNLRAFWNRTSNKPLTAELVRHAIDQLHGIAEALHKLHNMDKSSSFQVDPILREPQPESSGSSVPFIEVQDADDVMMDGPETVHKASMRHGDLKPENILVFSDAGQKYGVFRIADMGLAKKHIVETNLRGKITSTMFGTRRYEPPEAGGVQSRLFDVWSMGCIALEYLIWLLYGNASLTEFLEEIDKNQGQYYETQTVGQQPEHTVRSVVLRWMEQIRTKDPECTQESALRDLLELIQDRLLVVSLPPDSASSLIAGRLFQQPVDPNSITRYRAKAIDFRDALGEIRNRIKVSEPEYVLTGHNRSNIGPPLGVTSVLSEDLALRPNRALLPIGNDLPNAPLTGIHGRNHKADYSLPPLKGWEFPIDNHFSETVAALVEHAEVWPTGSSEICTRCRKLNFLAGGFAHEDDVTALQERSESCALCRLMHKASKLVSGAQGPRIRFERQHSKLVITSNPLPVLSIFRGPDLKPPPPLQLGFPKLPEPGSKTFFEVLKSWLRDCDMNHRDCSVGTDKTFPTRLIDVGTVSSPQVRLIETIEEEPSDHRYIALSHPWGDTSLYPPFNTVRTDKSGLKRDIESLKLRIPYEELPATFKDTIDSTRALGVRYLWIDSICIIQGKDGDFSDEAKKMEDVYSRAYCVFAASRARNQHDGFLKTRPPSSYVTLTGPGGTAYYICESIDNFTKDVLEGSLNQRGWVLQERALARRTIYFTEAQTYFECGSGIRCETLAKMHNAMADFLGDPNFPTKAMRTESRALKISYFQDLYHRYSRLKFTRDDDRPFAIAGIEKRLQLAYNTRGGYGIFDDGPDGGLFHRSLLWKRSVDDSNNAKGGVMRLINFPSERNIRVPSWSWMAYTGGIEYTDPPWRSADWEKDEISPPWTRDDDGYYGTQSAPHHLEMPLRAVVRDFNLAGRSKDEVLLTYDIERTASDGQRTQCVIVARSRMEESLKDKTHYVLLVAAERTLTDRGEKMYKRVGAGFMPGKYITLDVPGTLAKIY